MIKDMTIYEYKKIEELLIDSYDEGYNNGHNDDDYVERDGYMHERIKEELRKIIME